AAACRWARSWPADPGDPWAVPDGWRLGDPAPTVFRLVGGDRVVHVAITGRPNHAVVQLDDGEKQALAVELDDSRLMVTLDGRRVRYRVAECDGQLWIADGEGTAMLREIAEESARADAADTGDAEIRSPMPGSVIALSVASGAAV